LKYRSLNTKFQEMNLPFNSDHFTGRNFEDFCYDVLSLCPEITLEDGKKDKIIFVKYVEKPGLPQDGRDFLAKTEQGQEWAFECKHRPKGGWTDADTKKVLKEAIIPADRHFLWVSSEVHDKPREPLKYKPWELWDSRKIAGLLRSQLEPEQVAGILDRFFGPDTCEHFLGFVGSSALVSASRFFNRFDGLYFNHDYALQGRKDILEAMQAFVLSENKRILVLDGIGGLGKSRLLKAFSLALEEGEKKIPVRFLLNPGESWGRQLDRLGKGVVLVWDDVHQSSPELVRSILKEVSLRKTCKLLLSTRPQLLGFLRETLEAVGFDSSKVVSDLSVKKLGSEDAAKLAADVLGEEHEEKAETLGRLSRECPLVAVVGGQLIKERKISLQELQTDPDFIKKVWSRYRDEMEGKLEGEGDAALIRKLLPLISIMSPLKEDPELKAQIAGWLQCHVDDLTSAWKRLKHAGLLLESGNEVRVTPDPFSDFLVYDKCYDENGGSTQFAERVAEEFEEAAFSQILQNVAYCEWHARLRYGEKGWQPISEKIWKSFMGSFTNAPWFRRGMMLDMWSKNAFFLPEKTLALIDLILELKDEPEPQNETDRHVLELGMDGKQGLLAKLTNILQEIAVYHYKDEKLGEKALELLWQVAKELSPDEGVVIEALSKVGEYRIGRPIEVSWFVLEWLEHTLVRVSDQRWLEKRYGLMGTLFKPFFSKGAIPEDERLKKVDSLKWKDLTETRTKALKVLRRIVKNSPERIQLGVLQALDEALDVPRIAFDHPDRKNTFKFWEPSRKEAFELVQEIAQSASGRAVIYKARKVVRNSCELEIAGPFLNQVKSWLASIPETLDLQLAIVCMNYSHEEEGDWPLKDRKRPDGYYDRLEEKWRARVDRAVVMALHQFPEPLSLHGYLTDLLVYFKRLGFTPHVSWFLERLGKTNRSYALKLAQIILSSKESTLASSINSLFQDIEPEARNIRFEFMRRAGDSGGADLMGAVIWGYARWRREEPLSDEEKKWLLGFAARTPPILISTWMRLVETSRKEDLVFSYQILDKLSFLPDRQEANSVIHALGSVVRFAEIRPEAEMVGKILRQLVPLPELQGSDFEWALTEIAKEYPRQIYDFFADRIRYKENQASPSDEAYVPIGWFIEDMSITGLSTADEADRLLAENFNRYMDGSNKNWQNWQKLMQMAWIRPDGAFSKKLQQRIEAVKSVEDLKRLARLTKFNHSRLVLDQPELVRDFLKKATEYGSKDLNKIRTLLVQGAGPNGRGSTGGKMNEEDAYVLSEAKDLLRQYNEDPLLCLFYEEVVQNELSWIESIRLHDWRED
jgi:hypothetical protein